MWWKKKKDGKVELVHIVELGEGVDTVCGLTVKGLVPRISYGLTGRITCPTCINMARKKLNLKPRIMLEKNNAPALPVFPNPKIQREGGLTFCKCGSTMSRAGFLNLFGKPICDQNKCRINQIKR